MKQDLKPAYDALCRILAARTSPHSWPWQDNDPLWPKIFAVADGNLTLAELHRALTLQDALAKVPQDMRQALQMADRLTRERCVALRTQILEINACLGKRGIIPVWLKGATLLVGEGWQGNTRLMSDLDLWIPDPSTHAEALACLEQAGYAPKPGAEDKDWANSHHYAPLFHPRRLATLEVHRHIVRKALSPVLPDFWARERIERVRDGEETFCRLDLLARIRHSLVQCSLMSTPPLESGRIRLMKVMDLIALLRRGGHDCLPDEVLEPFVNRPWRRPMSRFLTLLERDFGIPNALDHDPTCARAVDHVLRHQLSPLAWRIRQMAQPARWRAAVRSPRSLASKFNTVFRPPRRL